MDNIKKMGLNIFVILLLALNVLSFVSADSDLVYSSNYIPPIRPDTCINVIQVCLNCSYNNITSIIYPNNSYAVKGNIGMTKSNTEYNYTFCSTSQLGDYVVNGFNDAKGWAYTFQVGKSFSVSQSIIALTLFLFLLCIFVLAIYSFIVIPFNNPRSPEGEILNVDFKKYFKLSMLALAYICLVGLIYFSWNFSYGILQFTELANFFFALYKMAYVLMFLTIPCLFIVAVIRFAKDMKILKELQRGLTVK